MTSTLDIEAELREILARRAIADAGFRYTRGLDRIDRAMLLSAFHEDAFVDCGLMQGGPGAFADFALGFLGDMHRTHHQLGQQHVAMQLPSHASGETYFQAYHDITDEQGQKRDLFIAGRYVDEYTSRDGQWKIAARTLITDWVTDTPGNRAFFEDNPEAPSGQRDGRDFSDRRDWPQTVRATLTRQRMNP
ncbi:nuclear transport factor 2 family protein [Croceicoccus sp. YJ47]|uniref:nuclear transport factor 2 family protein n=1 Tax=Croceicoccus sp. YJ47 TaxID=2798724 RepID=UPI001F2BFABB|nr:nuclear transport factor 2 family protein [Croceicoccus sp. YJ47]